MTTGAASHAVRSGGDGRRDVERAIAVLAERLPEPLVALARVAYDYSWTWALGGPQLFRTIDPTLWIRSGGNPRWLIEAVAPHRLRELAGDAGFLARLGEQEQRLEAQRARPSRTIGVVGAERPVAYFCSEFAVHATLPLYGGGLGVLAGDVLKAASDTALPMVGIGLLYRQGYFHQRLDLSGWQHESWVATDFERHPLVRVTTDDGRPLTVSVEIRNRHVQVQIWRADIGRVPLYLLDTDFEPNATIDRWITARLYVGDRHTRLAQYAVLGVGGVRALAALGVRPGLLHLNEGHAALANVERLAALVADGRDVDDALEVVRAGSVFTTHTPVAAGNEWYAMEEVEPVLGCYIDRCGLPRDRMYGFGRFRAEDQHEPMNITPLALRTSRKSIGVSRRHGEVARVMWQPLWSEREISEVPIEHVTNGVHTTSWMSRRMQSLLDRYLTPGWRERVAEPETWEPVAQIPSRELWETRRALRAHLVGFVRDKSVRDRLSHGEPPSYVEQAAQVFDEDTLTIGFGRRVATYKRLHLLMHRLERGLRLLDDAAAPIQIVIAGKAHPADDEAKQTLRRLLEVRRMPNVGRRIAFLEDYDLDIARRLVAGVDLWLNLPRPPYEASGTSGMKVVLNGGLNLSVLDGWWCEAYEPDVGWAIESPPGDLHTQDDHDALVLFDLLEHEVVPEFYERGADGIPERWLAKVRASLQRLAPRFSAQRMVEEYASVLYAPRPTPTSASAPPDTTPLAAQGRPT
ncbi:MAG TPA: alpha-glucan family phosphorylase [Candidatus Binatia bacterium]